MQTLIVSLCIAVAVIFMARKFYRVVKKNATCCGSASGGAPKCQGCAATGASVCHCHSQKPVEELTPKE